MEPAANALVPIAEELEDVYAQIDLLEVSVGLCVVKGSGEVLMLGRIGAAGEEWGEY